MEHVSHEGYVRRQRVVTVHKEMLYRKIGVIEGSRELAALRFEATEEQLDPGFITFVAIASGTDHLPVGGVREKWAAHDLAREDVEIEEAGDFYREAAFGSCRALISRFG